MSFVVVIPFTAHDIGLVEPLLRWIGELGGAKGFDCLLVNDVRLVKDRVAPVPDVAKEVFREVWLVHTPFPLPSEQWPLGANHMFETALRAMEPVNRPFLWLEPDCTPLRAGWLDVLATAYTRSGKPYLGQLIMPRKPDLPQVVMSGIAIYPADACKQLLRAVVQFKAKQAFDIATAGITPKRCAQTGLIYNFYGEKDVAPTFDASQGSVKNLLRWAAIPKQAVLFHRCKDGSLIRLLRERQGMAAAPAAPAATARQPAVAETPKPLYQSISAVATPKPARGPKEIYLGSPNLRGQVDGTAPVVKPPPQP